MKDFASDSSTESYQQLTLFEINSTHVPPSTHDLFWEQLEEQSTIDFVDATAHQQITSSVSEQIFYELPPYIGVGEQVAKDTQKSAHQHEITHWVEKYWVQRGDNKYWYFRYTWMLGRKLCRHYIGSARSPQALALVAVVKDAIAAGFSPTEIKELISAN